jgi:PAS domain-containing protein
VTTQPIQVILMRELADHLATPIFVVDAAGDLLFYNEPAERLLGSRFDETGKMPFAEWSTLFTPTNAAGMPIRGEELPLAVAVREQRPAQGSMWIRGLDGEHRELTVTAIPLQGQWGEHLGAAAIFWEAG